jgi:serine/threonine-protein kinase
MLGVALRTSLLPGTILQSTYEIVRTVGAGGMSEVYEARHSRLPGRFAVKILKAEVAPGSIAWQRFRREAEIASSLRHPHIVQVIDFHHTDDGVPYLVMELLEGEDLSVTLARQGRLSPARVRGIVDQIASALGAAHGQGVVHRDLKPQNVFLTAVGEGAQSRDFVKVLDFGISKVRTAATLTGESLIGTPRYMAPEQAQGRQDDIDGRTDEFALGAIAWEMLSGAAAFDGGDDVPATLFRIVNEPPAPLGSPPGENGAAIEAVLLRALAKRREDRYLTVAELALALAAAVDGDAGAPRPMESPTLPSARSGARERRATGALRDGAATEPTLGVVRCGRGARARRRRLARRARHGATPDRAATSRRARAPGSAAEGPRTCGAAEGPRTCGRAADSAPIGRRSPGDRAARRSPAASPAVR